VFSTALEAQIDRQLATVPEVTAAVAVSKETIQGGLTWLFVTLQEGQELDEGLERRLCLMLQQVIGEAKLPRVFQLSNLPRTHNGRVMKRALSKFINQVEVPNRAMMRNPQVLEEIACVTGLRDEVRGEEGAEDWLGLHGDGSVC
jgi:acyl-coenzyme A synthetase/AMP-(fatty) acid ligase